jgi:hypothetical protein
MNHTAIFFNRKIRYRENQFNEERNQESPREEESGGEDKEEVT